MLVPTTTEGMPVVMGDNKGAIADYDQSLRLDPNNAYAYIGRGIARSELGDNKGAIADYEQALRLDPNNALAYNNRKRLLQELEKSNGKGQASGQLKR